MVAGKENAGEIGIQDALPLFEGHLVDESPHIDAGIGEDAVRRAELLFRKREGFDDLRLVADVTGQAYRSARTLHARRISSFFCRLAILVQNGYTIPTPGAKQRGRPADTPAAPGHH